jgi:hypothetical protein
LLARKFKLDIPAERRRHTDPDRYVIYVLWMVGYSERSIAFVMGMRVKQIAGIIGRSEYKGRSTMTDHERRMRLLELKEIRMDDGFPLDRGKLNGIDWELLPLGKKQLRGPLQRKMRNGIAQG